MSEDEKREVERSRARPPLSTKFTQPTLGEVADADENTTHTIHAEASPLIEFFKRCRMSEMLVTGSSGTPRHADAARVLHASRWLSDAARMPNFVAMDFGSGGGRIGVVFANQLLWATRTDLITLFRLSHHDADAAGTDAAIAAALNALDPVVVYIEIERLMAIVSAVALASTADALPGLVAAHPRLRWSTTPEQISAVARILRAIQVYPMDGTLLTSLHGVTHLLSGDRVLPLKGVQPALLNLVAGARAGLHHVVTCLDHKTTPRALACAPAVCAGLLESFHIINQFAVKLVPGKTGVTYFVLINKDKAQMQMQQQGQQPRIAGMPLACMRDFQHYLLDANRPGLMEEAIGLGQTAAAARLRLQHLQLHNRKLGKSYKYGRRLSALCKRS